MLVYQIYILFIVLLTTNKTISYSLKHFFENIFQINSNERYLQKMDCVVFQIYKLNVRIPTFSGNR